MTGFLKHTQRESTCSNKILPKSLNTEAQYCNTGENRGLAGYRWVQMWWVVQHKQPVINNDINNDIITMLEKEKQDHSDILR